MKKLAIIVLCFTVVMANNLSAQSIRLTESSIEPVNVFMSIEKMDRQNVVRVIKDSSIRKFDEPTFVKIKGINFKNGIIEVKVLSKLLKDAPDFARGFIGIAFRIDKENKRFESIYIRPTNARSDDQVRRNHSIQYYAYPDYKFDRLRKEAPERYESYTDMEINKWITMRITIKDAQAKLFIDENKEPSLIVNDLKLGTNASGAIGLWVDIGTEGFFSDFKDYWTTLTKLYMKQMNVRKRIDYSAIRFLKREAVLKFFWLTVLTFTWHANFSQQDSTRLRYFMQSVPSSPNAVPYGANKEAGRDVDVGDAKIYYEVYGSGEPVVVLHGGVVGSTYEMGQFIDSLSKDYQVIAISTRGHGKSEMGKETSTFQRKAKDVEAVLNAVTKDSVVVLGFSDGAYTGYFLAVTKLSRVKKLISIGAGEWKRGFRSFKNTRESLFAMDSLYFTQQLALMPESKRFGEWLEQLNKYYNSASVGKEIFSKIKCPVLVMAGELDQNAHLKTIIDAYETIPNAQLSIIPNAPHPVFLVNFPAVWTSMVPFLK